ncbi:MAG: GNAT family N-acetyltransferase [Oscillospiraceae bacterium]
MEIRLAGPRDIGGWMELVGRVRDSFPGLESEAAMAEHRRTALAFMDRGGAICAEAEDGIAGALLFSGEEGELCFLAVDPPYRRRGIASGMVSCMLTLLEPGQDVTVTTYREGTPEGEAARAFYKRLGFTEGALTEAFGSPVQELVWKRGE